MNPCGRIQEKIAHFTCHNEPITITMIYICCNFSKTLSNVANQKGNFYFRTRLKYFLSFLKFNDVVKEGRSYDCGVEFTADGAYGRPDYLIRASSSNFSLHSLYLLLWCNFGAFCISMLTQPDGEQQIIQNKILSDINPIRHYCVSQLQSFWLHMQQNMRLSTEELSFFMTKCMYSLIEVSECAYTLTFCI